MIDDVDVASDFAAFRLERKASWLELRAMARIFHDIMPGWLSRCRVPPALHAIKHGKTLEFKVGDDGRLLCTAIGSDAWQPVIPDDFDPSSVLVITSLLDRCSVGTAGMSLLVSEGSVLMHPH